MTGLGRATMNLLSAANENTLALASLKFDFSLVKIDAPAEFSGLGAALSSRRRIDAEGGPHHKTARRLAALFEQIVPSTPRLITAYGLRSSEIIQTPGINPKGSTKHGPFEAFVGADGTAMWAAATSGIPALGVYLLACLLARAWDTKEAISIWVELVDRRRIEIEEMAKGNHVVSEATRMSVNHDISREDLAQWDASARAWLQSADQAKVKEQTQLMLIVKNLSLPFNGGISTYRKVIDAWRQSMSRLEDLLCGRPQQISNRAIMLAFSAWHLYPDLVVLGKEITNVRFKDPLLHPQGIATISLERLPNKADQCSSWSLALSHLRYYGNPVTVESHTDFTRVTIQQLHIVALGCLLDSWDIHKRDTLSVAQWFVDLWGFLYRHSSKDYLGGLDWLQYLAQAAKTILQLGNRDKQTAIQLLDYGRRRAKCFLGDPAKSLEPFFGLGRRSILAGLSEVDESERGVAYFRMSIQTNGMRNSEVYIRSIWRHWTGSTHIRISEYMTAIPHTYATSKRDLDGNQQQESVHARWLHVERWTPSQWIFVADPETESGLQSVLHDRLEYLIERGERGTLIYRAPRPLKQKIDWQWDDLPAVFNYPRHAQRSYCCPSLIETHRLCNCFDCDGESSIGSQEPAIFSLYQSIGACSYFAKSDPHQSRQGSQEYITIRGENYLHPGLSTELLCTSSIEPKVLSAYLQFHMSPSQKISTRESLPQLSPITQSGRENGEEAVETDYLAALKRISRQAPGEMRGDSTGEDRSEYFNYREELAKEVPVSEIRSWAFHALVAATRVYSKLDGATISLKIVDCPLNEASWLIKEMITEDIAPDHFLPSTYPKAMSRSSALACIFHFESGTLMLRPTDLEKTLAIASGNSIFAIGALIADPFDIIPPDSIKRITGNIGSSGTCLLVAPIDPEVRPLGDQYNLVTHAPYDGKREDNFTGTSLHLSFTTWKLPLEGESQQARTIDQEAYLVESVIRVLDSGKWVADLDILGIDFKNLLRIRMEAPCPGHLKGESDYDYTSLDTWEELLDGPTSVGFFRARGNWAARLAAVSILAQKDQAHSVGVLGPASFCLECLSSNFDDHGGLRRFESTLPSFCID